MPSPRRKSQNLMQKASLTITDSLEWFFDFWGRSVARRPLRFILGCMLLSGLCGLGLFRFKMENRPDKLWIPTNSDFLRDSDWLRENFPAPIRFHHAIITAENVLEPKIMKLLVHIHDRVRQIVTSTNRSYSELCFKLPVTKYSNPGSEKSRRRRSIDDELNFDDDFYNDTIALNTSNLEFDPSVDLPQSIYCDVINLLDEDCWESNVVEIWNYNSSVIESLTKENIIDVINTKSISPVFGRPVNYTTELGGIVKNETGHIIAANSVLLRWFGRINYSDMKNNVLENDLGTGELVDHSNLLWETEFVNLMLNFPLPEGVKLYFRAGRSFGDISSATIYSDANMLALGFFIVFIYIIFMLGKCNCIEQKPLLALAGLVSIALAIPLSYGICSFFGLVYGPVHNILPFLLLGIGIDDMFVIMASWNNLPESLSKLPRSERMGKALKHAGVSITITSVTDFLAFVIGGTTVLPALQSFCVYAAVGIVATYFFQATFFTACLALDVQRIENRRNAFCVCYRHGDRYRTNSCSKNSIAKKLLGGIYSDVLFSVPVKIVVLISTFILTGFGIWGNILLRQEFNPMWFLPQDSYLFQFYIARDLYFPGMGFEAMVVLGGNITLNSELAQVDELVNNLKSSDSIYDVDAWYPYFKEYGNTRFDLDTPNTTLTQKQFDKYISRFLFSPTGARFRGRFKFSENITCGLPAPKIEVSMFTFKFKTFLGPEEHIPVMHEVKNYVERSFPEPSHRAFVWSIAFATWETDEIITMELYRNMALAMICVFFTTLVLIANAKTCVMVLLCVTLTLVDVLGGMYYWDLTIDTISCVDLVLAIGLCVDYAAHIAHTFMTIDGTRNERARQSLSSIGTAVLNGGVSTFLAFVLLASSKSHVFLTFYKVLFLVVIFGLYHGLVFLPVVLSIIGPSPYASASIEIEQESEVVLQIVNIEPGKHSDETQ